MATNRTSSRLMGKLREQFFTEGKRLSESDDETERLMAACWLCHQPIDYTVTANTTPDSHNLDHYYPVGSHPELQTDPANFRHSHALCNTQRSNRIVDGGGLGEAVPKWW